MESLLIESTERTPLIEFNSLTGHFKIEGNSIPEDTLAFYKPIFTWLDNYLETGGGVTLQVQLSFFNTSTSKCLFNIFKKVQSLHDKGRTSSILWLYDLKDTDMFESGLDFQNLLKLPFDIQILTSEG